MDLSSSSSNKQVVPFLLRPCKSSATSTKRQKATTCETYVAEELLEQILVRLPVKSLLRLKATCKNWRSLIDSPSFIDLHAWHHRLDYKNCLVFSCERIIGSRPQSVGVAAKEEDDGGSLYSWSLPTGSTNIRFDSEVVVSDLGWLPRVAFAKWPQDIINNAASKEDWHSLYPGVMIPPLSAPYCYVFGPLKSGIYCEIYADCQMQGYMNVATSKFALSNLATRDYKFLNPFPADAAALLSNLSRKPCCVYFGFGSVYNEAGHVVDYKMVFILLSGLHLKRFLSFVYSLRRGRWDKIADIRRGMMAQSRNPLRRAVAGLVDEKGEFDTPRMLSNFGILQCPQLFCNGFWHWLEPPYIPSRRYDRVLRFDVAKEAFGWIRGPPHDHFLEGNLKPPRRIHFGLLQLNDNLATAYLPHIMDSRGKWHCLTVEVWTTIGYRYGNKDWSWTKIYSCDAFRGSFKTVSLVGLCYETLAGSNVLHIQRIFLRDFDTKELVSCDGDDGAQMTKHGYFKHHRKLWRNVVGVSTYLETLHPLTLPH